MFETFRTHPSFQFLGCSIVVNDHSTKEENVRQAARMAPGENLKYNKPLFTIINDFLIQEQCHDHKQKALFNAYYRLQGSD